MGNKDTDSLAHTTWEKGDPLQAEISMTAILQKEGLLPPIKLPRLAV